MIHFLFLGDVIFLDYLRNLTVKSLD